MKKLLNNKKGFTLIELLAVIVILAILVMVAIPAVTKYLNAARQGTFADNAKSAISAVRNDVIMNGFGSDASGATTSGSVMTYDQTAINGLLEKKLETSPFGGTYKEAKITVTQEKVVSSCTTDCEYKFTYKMCLIDNGGHGFNYLEENSITDKKVELSGQTTCGQ